MCVCVCQSLGSIRLQVRRQGWIICSVQWSKVLQFGGQREKVRPCCCVCVCVILLCVEPLHRGRGKGAGRLRIVPFYLPLSAVVAVVDSLLGRSLRNSPRVGNREDSSSHREAAIVAVVLVDPPTRRLGSLVLAEEGVARRRDRRPPHQRRRRHPAPVQGQQGPR